MPMSARDRSWSHTLSILYFVILLAFAFALSETVARGRPQARRQASNGCLIRPRRSSHAHVPHLRIVLFPFTARELLSSSCLDE